MYHFIYHIVINMLYEYLLCTLLHKDKNLKNNIWGIIAKKLRNKINGKKNSGKLQYLLWYPCVNKKTRIKGCFFETSAYTRVYAKRGVKSTQNKKKGVFRKYGRKTREKGLFCQFWHRTLNVYCKWIVHCCLHCLPIMRHLWANIGHYTIAITNNFYH